MRPRTTECPTLRGARAQPSPGPRGLAPRRRSRGPSAACAGSTSGAAADRANVSRSPTSWSTRRKLRTPRSAILWCFFRRPRTRAFLEHLQREERWRQRSAHVVSDPRRERLELVRAPLLHRHEVPRTAEPEPRERRREQSAHDVGHDREPAGTRPRAIGLQRDLRPVLVVELDEAVERVVGLLRRRLELAPGPGLRLLQRAPTSMLACTCSATRRGRIEPTPRVLLELDFRPEPRQVQVAPPRLFGEGSRGRASPASVRDRLAPPPADRARSGRQASSDCAQLDDARQRVVGDLVRLLGDGGHGCPRTASNP